ncbi:hypothetical protein T4E_10362, partial [Trichinella pseudospiralis]
LLWVLFIIFDFFKLQIHLHLEKREYKIYMNPVMASVLKDADADDTKQTGSQTVCVIFHGSPLCKLVRGYFERLKLSCGLIKHGESLYG